MISEKETLIGILNTGVKYIQPVTQEKNVTPSLEVQEVIPDENYTGLSKVTVDPIPSEYSKVEGTIDITTNGEYDVKNYEKAKVSIGGVTKGLILSDYDSDGFPAKAEIIGMTEIPDSYLYYVGYAGSTSQYIFKNIQSIILPNNLTSIGYNSFYNNSFIKNITFPETLEYIAENGFTGSKVSELEIPLKVSEISMNALRNNASCTKITLNGDITSIGAYAFYGNNKMEQLIMPNLTSVPSLADINFLERTLIASGTGYIYVPDNLIDSFKSATNWSTYADQIKGISELV